MTAPRRLNTIVAAALLALFAVACQPQAATDGATAAAPAETPAGTPAHGADLKSFKTGQFDKLEFMPEMAIPASPFMDAAGNPHSFAEFQGKVVVFNIWAEWCAPCVEEMPTLAGLQKAFAGKDVVVVPIAFGYPEARDSAKKKLQELVGDQLPFYYDDKFNVNADAKSGAFPSTIIYDKQGKERARLIYPAKWDAPDAVGLVQAVLDEAS
jgi:thiol-disulfide isomerase/thioredoxin